MAKRRNTKKLVSAHEQSVDALFNADSFVLDYYQREYVWEEENVRKLLEDVQDEFYDEHNKIILELEYFIGSIVAYPDAQGTFRLIDGQQRALG